MLEQLNDQARQTLERGGLIDMTTTGRRTGQPRRIEIALHNVGGRLFISGAPSPTKRSWIANLETNPRLTIHLKGEPGVDRPATARIVTDETERRAILAPIARVWNRELEPMVAGSPLIEVTLDAEPGTAAA